MICLNDRIAMGAYQACAELKLAVPQNVSIISFDDSDLASWARPQLTSVAHQSGAFLVGLHTVNRNTKASITLVFSELQVSELPTGYAPFVVDSEGV